jgi:hypothetical protein
MLKLDQLGDLIDSLSQGDWVVLAIGVGLTIVIAVVFRKRLWNRAAKKKNAEEDKRGR